MAKLRKISQKHRKSCLIIMLICLVIVTFFSINRETLSFKDFKVKPNTVTKVIPVKNSESATPKQETYLQPTGGALVKMISDLTSNDYKSSSQQPVSSRVNEIIQTTSTQPNQATSEERGIQINNHTENIDFKNIEDIMITKPIEFLPSYKNPCWIGTHDNGPINDDKLHCLPYFYLIGVKKSGTTDLFGRLQAHPDFISPGFKEAQWFARLRFQDSMVPIYLKRIIKKVSKYDHSELSFYVSLFDQAAKTITARGARVRASINPFITAEASPSNLHKSLYWEHMPGNEGLTEPKYTTLHNIKHLNPNVKIIIIFRDPVERSYSDYIHDSVVRNKNASSEKFHNVAQTLMKSYQACFSVYTMRRCLYNFTWIKELQVETSSYMDFQAGFYAFYMKELWDVFGKDHVLPLLMKDYAEDTEGTLNKVFSFLNLSANSSSIKMLQDTKRNNHASAKKKSGHMLAETKSILYDFFKPFNLEMSEVMEDTRYLFPQPVVESS